MLLEDSIINAEVRKVYEEILQYYRPSNILGLFPIGLVNYGLLEDLSEMKYILVYIPSFEDLCTTVPKVYKDDRFEQFIEILDIRNCYKIASNLEYGLLEITYSGYSIINEKYKSVYTNYLYSNRDKFAHYSPALRVNSIYSRAKSAYEHNNNFEVVRLRLSLDRYLSNKPIEECFYIADTSLNKKILLDVKETNRDAKEELDEIEEINLSMPVDFDPDINIMIKTAIIEIIKKSMSNDINIDVFKEILTDNELKAFQLLKDKIAVSGYVSVSQLIKESSLSRPVYNNLFNKIKENKVATIENKGVKGTYIEWNE